MSVRPSINFPGFANHRVTAPVGFGVLGDTITTTTIPGTSVESAGTTSNGLWYGANTQNISFIRPSDGASYTTYISNIPVAGDAGMTVADLNAYAARVPLMPRNCVNMKGGCPPVVPFPLFHYTLGGPGYLPGTSVPATGKIPGTTLTYVYPINGSSIAFWDSATGKQYTTYLSNLPKSGSTLSQSDVYIYGKAVQQAGYFTNPNANVHWGPIILAIVATAFTAGVASGAIGGAAGTTGAAAGAGGTAAATGGEALAPTTGYFGTGAAINPFTATGLESGGSLLTTGTEVATGVSTAAKVVAPTAPTAPAPTTPTPTAPAPTSEYYGGTAPETPYAPPDNLTAPSAPSAPPAPSGGISLPPDWLQTGTQLLNQGTQIATPLLPLLTTPSAPASPSAPATSAATGAGGALSSLAVPAGLLALLFAVGYINR
jgi:hypothetical protein